MSYIYDSDMTLDEVMEYANRCSARQAQDTKAFLEILSIVEDADVGAYEACVEIADICKERLKQ